MLPLAAGLVCVFSEESAFRMAPGPVPLPFCVKIPGAVAASCRLGSFDVCPAKITSTNGALLPATSYGTMALIWVALT